MQGMVNQVILDRKYPTGAKIFVLHENAVLRSEDRGKTWAVLLEDEIASLAAFQGETTDLSLLVGLVDGSVKRI
jgi:hypothetical protein